VALLEHISQGLEVESNLPSEQRFKVRKGPSQAWHCVSVCMFGGQLTVPTLAAAATQPCRR
jgi:hypothetical protein